MSDVVVTIPKTQWARWLTEGFCAPDGKRAGQPGRTIYTWTYYIRVHNRPRIKRGERVYVVAHGRLRGYAPLAFIEDDLSVGLGGPGYRNPEGDPLLEQWMCDEAEKGPCAGLGEAGPYYYLVRRGGAVAVTIPEPIQGFQGWRYRWWDRADEAPFPRWKTEGVADRYLRSAAA